MYEPQLRDEVSQGDVITDVSIVFTDFEEDGTRALGSDARPLPPRILKGPAIILSRDCEYDKSKWIIVALIRPLSAVHQGSQGHIRSRRTLNTFYLEAITDHFPESYADFRAMERVNRNLIIGSVTRGNRVASLTDEARLALQRQVALYFGYNSER